MLRAPLRTAVLVLTLGLGLTGVATAQAATPAAKAPAAQPAAKPAAKPAHKTMAQVTAERHAFSHAILTEAAKHNGAPYVYGAAGPGAFDCSGFTRYVYAKMGISLPHSSYAQWNVVEHIPNSQAQPGDIVFLNGLGHVGIYAGHGMMWDAPAPGRHVLLRPIYSSVYRVGRVRL